MHIVCESCGATNRMPEDKNHHHAKCGACGKAVYSAKPVVLDDANFFDYIEKNQLPVIVDFWAQWCGPCRAMIPVYEELAGESDGILFAKVDTQAAQQISAEAGVRSLPTLVFFHKGREIDRISGGLRASQMKQWIMQCVQKLQ